MRYVSGTIVGMVIASAGLGLAAANVHDRDIARVVTDERELAVQSSEIEHLVAAQPAARRAACAYTDARFRAIAGLLRQVPEPITTTPPQADFRNRFFALLEAPSPCTMGAK